MDVAGSLAVAWALIYLLVRYAGTLLADRRAARIPSRIGSRPAARPNTETV